MRFLKPRNLPTRIATGAYILHTGLEKWHGDEQRAIAIHGMAAGAYPIFKGMPPTRFLRLLAAAEIAVGTALLLPFVSNARAGAALTGFSGGLVVMYLRTPALHKPGSYWPTPGRHWRQQGCLDARDRPRPPGRPLGALTCARDVAPGRCLASGGSPTTSAGASKRAFSCSTRPLGASCSVLGFRAQFRLLCRCGAMQRSLPDARASLIVRASFFGAISSSCSYAASATAKSLFQKGADFVASMVFMFASTNLVVELGVVLAVLIGWQFVAAEFVGGAIMIALLAMAGGLFLRGRALDEARRRVGTALVGHPGDELAEEPHAVLKRFRSLAGWSDVASYTMADIGMLRREMLVGYGVAGFLAVLVPLHVWSDVFLRGHGVATTVENVVVGPFIAIISFVCSIGNVPLAAALWNGGISFGGVVSFIFADLITMPLLVIYRKLYGAWMALRMLVVFWCVMSLAGLATEALFRVAALVPTARSSVVTLSVFPGAIRASSTFSLSPSSGFYGCLADNRRRLGGGKGYATDPVCGMQVEITQAPASASYGGGTVYFCSGHCRERFTRSCRPVLDRHGCLGQDRSCRDGGPARRFSRHHEKGHRGLYAGRGHRAGPGPTRREIPPSRRKRPQLISPPRGQSGEIVVHPVGRAIGQDDDVCRAEDVLAVSSTSRLAGFSMARVTSWPTPALSEGRL